MAPKFEDLLKAGAKVASQEVNRKKAQGPVRFDDLLAQGATLSEAPSELESGVRGAVQGSTLGFSDEIQGALQGLWDSLTTEEKLAVAYAKRRDDARKANELAEAVNPKSYMAGEIGGGLASAVAGGAAGLSLKGASVAGRLGAAALEGAGYGAAQGLGYSKADDVAGMVKDTASGAAVGGATGLASGAIGEGIRAYKGRKPVQAAAGPVPEPQAPAPEPVPVPEPELVPRDVAARGRIAPEPVPAGPEPKRLVYPISDEALAADLPARAKRPAPEPVPAGPELPPAPKAPEAAPKAAEPGIHPEDILENPDLDAKFAETLTKGSGKIERLFKSLGLEFPTAEGFVLRDLDAKKQALGKLRRRGILESAPRALLEDPRYAQAKLPDQKVALITTKQSEAGETIGNILRGMDEALVEPSFDVLSAVEKIDRDLVQDLKRNPKLNGPAINKVEDVLSDFMGQGDQLTLNQVEEFKRTLDPFLKWDSEVPGPVKEALQKVRGILNGEIEKHAHNAAKLMGQPEIYEQWKAAKLLYGQMTMLKEIAESRLVDAKTSNRLFSLTDYLSMGAGGAGVVGSLMTGNPLPALSAAGGAVGALGNKWLRERGAHVMALATRGGPGTVLHEVLSSAPQKLGKFAQPLQAAASRGPRAVAAADYLLQQRDPEYRALVKKLEEEHGNGQ